MRMLRVFSVFGECEAPPVGWNMNYSVFSRFQWIREDSNILKTMTRKTEEKRFVPCGRSLSPGVMSWSHHIQTVVYQHVDPGGAVSPPRGDQTDNHQYNHQSISLTGTRPASGSSGAPLLFFTIWNLWWAFSQYSDGLYTFNFTWIKRSFLKVILKEYRHIIWHFFTLNNFTSVWYLNTFAPSS